MKKIYLAIPYTGMEESSFEQANEVTATLMSGGFNVFSPIGHCHYLQEKFELPGQWEFWRERDFQFIDWADELWVLVPIEGFDKVINSVGVQAEIDYARENKKNILYITYDHDNKTILRVRPTDMRRNDYLVGEEKP